MAHSLWRFVPSCSGEFLRNYLSSVLWPTLELYVPEQGPDGVAGHGTEHVRVSKGEYTLDVYTEEHCTDDGIIHLHFHIDVNKVVAKPFTTYFTEGKGYYGRVEESKQWIVDVVVPVWKGDRESH